MKRLKRKAFTIVELVIVIAVIAILAAVLLPTFSNVIEKAKLATTQQLVRELNTTLRTDTEKHLTMHDAIISVEKSGFTAESIRNHSDYKLLWNQVDDLFAYYDKDRDTLVYFPENQSAESRPDYTYWEIVASIPEVAEQRFSLYLSDSISGSVTVAVGLDVGENESITNINYSNAENQDIIIRTHENNTSTVIKLGSASSGSVTHYGRILGVNNESAMSVIEKGVFDPNYVVVEMLSEKATYTRGGTTISIDEANAPNFEPQQGDIVIDGKYEYHYKQYMHPLNDWNNNNANEGWGVKYLGTESTPSRMHNSIAGKDILYLCNTFKNNTSITTAPMLPTTVIEMLDTFFGCTNLVTASAIPDGVTGMSGAFQGCTGLTAAPDIPDGVTNLNGTFKVCTSLTAAPELPEDLIDMLGAFEGCTSLTVTSGYIIPANVKNMKWAFCGCTALTGTIEIKSNVLENYYQCFSDTKKSITLTGTESNIATLTEIATSRNNVTYTNP